MTLYEDLQYSRYGDGKRNCVPKVGPENGSQKWETEGILSVPTLRIKFFSGPYFWDTFYFPFPIFESKFLFGPQF